MAACIVAPFLSRRRADDALVGPRSKYRLLSEVLRNSQPPARKSHWRNSSQRKFGGEVLDYLVDPFVRRFFLATRARWGCRARFQTWRNGNEAAAASVRGAVRAYRYEARRALNRRQPPSHGDSGAKHGGLYVTDALPALDRSREVWPRSRRSSRKNWERMFILARRWIGRGSRAAEPAGANQLADPRDGGDEFSARSSGVRGAGLCNRLLAAAERARN